MSKCVHLSRRQRHVRGAAAREESSQQEQQRGAGGETAGGHHALDGRSPGQFAQPSYGQAS